MKKIYLFISLLLALNANAQFDSSYYAVATTSILILDGYYDHVYMYFMDEVIRFDKVATAFSYMKANGWLLDKFWIEDRELYRVLYCKWKIYREPDIYYLGYN